MFDGGAALAAAARRQVPYGGQIIRARWHRFLIFVVVVLATTAYALYSFVATGTTTLSSLPDSHGSTVLFQSFAILFAALLMLSVLVLATWRFLRASLRLLVLLPEGFVYGLAQSHHVLACASYRDVAHLRFQVVGRIPLPLFSHLELVCTDRSGVETIWRIEEVLALPAPEIARRIIAAWTSIGSASDAAARSQEGIGQITPDRVPPRQVPMLPVPPVPAGAVVAWALASRAAPDWRVVLPKMPELFWWRTLRTYAPMALVAVSLVGSSLLLLIILAVLLFAGTAPPVVEWFLAILIIVNLLFQGGILFAAFLLLDRPLARRRRLMTQVIILTPWALILADRHRGHVEAEQRFDDLADLRLRRWLGSFTLVMQTRAGRRWTLPLYKDQFAEAVPASIAQEVFIHAARFAAMQASVASERS